MNFFNLPQVSQSKIQMSSHTPREPKVLLCQLNRHCLKIENCPSNVTLTLRRTNVNFTWSCHLRHSYWMDNLSITQQANTYANNKKICIFSSVQKLSSLGLLTKWQQELTIQPFQLSSQILFLKEPRTSLNCQSVCLPEKFHRYHK